MESKTKLCCRCGIEKPIGDFSLSSKSKDGHQSMCKECQRIYNHDYFADGNHRPSNDESKKSSTTVKFDSQYILSHTEEILKIIPPRIILKYLQGRGYVWDKMQFKTIVLKDVVLD